MQEDDLVNKVLINSLAGKPDLMKNYMIKH